MDTDKILSAAKVQLSSLDRNRWAGVFAVVGVLGLGGTGLGLISQDQRLQTLHSYLIAFMFVATIAVGGLFFAMLQHLVGARWSATVRRLAENLGATLPVVAVLFIPIAINIKTIYPWADLEGASEAVKLAVEEKHSYLNMPFFMGRMVFYLLAWAGLGTLFYQRSLELDRTGDPRILLSLRKLAAPGILTFALTLTFAGFDWLMSLDPTWYSTMFGVYTFAGTFLSALSAIVLLALTVQRWGYLKDVINVEHYHDLGKLMFGFIVFWAYIAFSQFFLIWYANIPEETQWYRYHWEGGWAPVTVFLLMFHFVVPFFAILSRHPKRNPAAMTVISLLLIVMHYVDIYWVVMPKLHPTFSVSWLDAAALCGVGGIFLAALWRRMGAAPLIPVKDPLLAAALEYDNG